jgi:hypothetical protein
MPLRLRFLYASLNLLLVVIPALELYRLWDRIRSAELQIVLFYGAAIGVGLIMMLLMLTGRLVYRGEKSPGEA